METNNKKETWQKNIKQCNTLKECISKSNIIISGMPITKDNNTIYAPYGKEIIKLAEVKEYLENKQFIAGMIPKCYENLNEKNVEIFDLILSERLTILNAIPTVEGTMKIAIEETESTIHESNIMILGYGRIGKILCDRFQKMGANVYCAARKEKDLTWIRAQNCVPVRYEEIEEYCQGMNIIINTVPSLIINENFLKKLDKECIIIDVASNPGGVDKLAAEMYKIKVITALGIPGKIAPKTAAKYIKDIIEEKLNNKGGIQ